MGHDNTDPQTRRNRSEIANATDAKRQTLEDAAALVRENDQDHGHAVEAIEGSGRQQELQSDPSSALQEEAQDLRAVEQTTQEKSAVKNTEPGWRHIGRVPGAPDPAQAKSNPSSRRPLQLPTEVCKRIIDWQWDNTPMLRRCALVCKAWTPRCRYWMQRHVFLWDRSSVQGHVRRARAQSHLLRQARSVAMVGGANANVRGPIPHLGTFAMMGAGKLPLVWRLDILRAMWKPRDFHPLTFVHLSAFSSLTALWLLDVTFPKVRKFGRLVCALPSLVHLRCNNVLFTSMSPCASLAITRCPPSVRLTDLVIFSDDKTSSNVEANKVLIEHLCTAGVVADLQRFEFSAWESSNSNYLDVYQESIHELLKQCSWSLHSMKLLLGLNPSKDVQIDAISDTIGTSIICPPPAALETVALEATNFEEVGYSWMFRVLESNALKKLREVSIVMNEAEYSENAEENLQRTVSALRKDLCPHLDELFSNKEYEKLHHVDFMFLTHPDQVIPDATRWSTLLKAEMPKLDEQGVLRTHVDVFLELWNEDFV
ncbi:hypothetical protein WOLCODRAFT_157505 [Wolfiporia cocos MD-104 SS10]|uniref:F-box domain-containing protein n=1 Tax=Wolfiporia cocos (strain MD-104) TaxID=742152 RepID=A0A2H3JJE0_WOLCO|nr:hypothetical protein WOLCODRAFT_157505 [Wolfiporia cocos MD-104 SS10]